MFMFLKKMKEYKLTDEQMKWNKMWDLWAEEKIGYPYQALMTYQSELNNGGHAQYFTNIENFGDLEQEFSALHLLLSPELRSNLQDAYRAYLVLEETGEDEREIKALERCDDAFYEMEEQITHLLEVFSREIEL